MYDVNVSRSYVDFVLPKLFPVLIPSLSYYGTESEMRLGELSEKTVQAVPRIQEK